MKMGDPAVVDVGAISSGSLGLDIALGVGGYPRGRVVEIYGPESSGKTTLTLHAIAEAQKAGGIAAFIDAEHAFDKFYAQNLGVDIDNLIISQPDHGEQALEIAENLIRSGAIDIVVIDSVAAFERWLTVITIIPNMHLLLIQYSLLWRRHFLLRRVLCSFPLLAPCPLPFRRSL